MKSAEPRLLGLIALMTAFATTIAGCGGGGSSTTTTQYNYKDITPPGQTGVAVAINNSAQILIDTPAAGDITSTTSDCFVLSGGSFTDLGATQHGAKTVGLFLNEHGAVLFQFGSQSPITTAVYQNGQTTTLPSLSGPGQVIGFSDSGSVLANASPNFTTTSWIYNGTSWQTASTVNPVLASYNAVGFAKDGSVIFADNDGVWVVSSAKYTNYGLPVGGGPISPKQVFVNTNGVMAGSSQVPFTTGSDKFLFGGTATSGLTSLITPGTNSVVISGQNNNGVIIANTNNPGQETVPILYQGGRYTDIRGLANFPSGASSIEVNGINDQGQICGGFQDPIGTWHAFLLTPT